MIDTVEKQGKALERESKGMSDYQILNSMTRDELLAFAFFAYTASPTLLRTHLGREAFRAQYPDKATHMGPAIPNLSDEDVGEEKQIAFDFDGTGK